MKTIHYYAILFTLTTAATLVLCESSSEGEKSPQAILPFENQQRVERSPKYDFGLGKRRYIITTGGPGKKRLPHYNFGLGKRSNPYAYQFGLGKRADGDDISNYDDEIFDKDDINQENFRDGGLFDNKNDIDVLDYGYDNPNFMPREYKRARQYSFGLGKRKYSDELDKRLPNRYNFGLGK